MMRLIWALITFVLAGPPVAACGPDTDCMVGERHYRIVMPADHDGNTPVPALVFAHGYRGSAAGVMRNGSLRRLASDLGAALIAVKSDGPAWDLPNSPRDMASTGAAELAYFDAVLADATSRYPVDPTRLVATGFSAGGMMVWTLACARSADFAGFVPIAGTYWLKPPASCSLPVANIIHIHGDNDKTVPLTGRAIGQTHQGDVAEALKMYQGIGAFSPSAQQTYGGLRCEEQRNDAKEVLDFCLFSGGHSFRTEHLRHAWERLRDTGQL